jgi:hypothetical protein
MRRSLLIGPTNSGKSYAAGIIKQNRPMLGITPKCLENYSKLEVIKYLQDKLTCYQRDTQVVIIDPIPIEHIITITQFFLDDDYYVNPSYEKPYKISPQEVILVCECSLQDIVGLYKISRHYAIFNCGQANETGVAMTLINPETFAFDPSPTL